MNPDALVEGLRLKIQRRVEDRAGRAAQAAKRAADAEGKKLLIYVATELLGKTEKPSLAPSSGVEWPDLSEEWVEEKGSDRFFRNTGWLIDQLKAMSDATKFYGKAAVRKEKQGKGRYTYFIKPYSSTMDKALGSSSEAGSLLVKLLPNPITPENKDSRKRKKPRHRPGLHTKLLGPRRIFYEKRPVLAQAMIHFIDYRIRRAANKAVREALK